MQEQMHVLPSYDDGDQGFLNAFFSQVPRMSCSASLD